MVAEKDVKDLDEHNCITFQCVRQLLQEEWEYRAMGALREVNNSFIYKTPEGGNLLHFSIQYSVNNEKTHGEDTSLCLQELLVYLIDKINETDCYSEFDF